MITEDYVSFEIAKLLKEKGFDEPTRMFYEVSNYPSSTAREKFKKITGRDMKQIEIHSLYGLEDEPFFNSVQGKDENQVACPTLQMAMKWLRKENLFVEIYTPSHSDHEDTIYHNTWSFDLFNLKTKKYMYCTYGEVEYNSYEEACESAIKYCLENLI